MTTQPESSFEVVVLTDTLTKSASGRLGGEIWIRVANVDFPGPQWEDFIVVVLGWWLQAVVTLWPEMVASDLLFMDGPYEMRLAPLRNGRVLVVGKERLAVGYEVLLEGSVDPTVIQRAVLQASVSVLDECRKRGWTDGDVETLATGARTLEGHLSR